MDLALLLKFLKVLEGLIVGRELGRTAIGKELGIPHGKNGLINLALNAVGLLAVKGGDR
jgi:hypothetical protein